MICDSQSPPLLGGFIKQAERVCKPLRSAAFTPLQGATGKRVWTAPTAQHLEHGSGLKSALRPLVPWSHCTAGDSPEDEGVLSITTGVPLLCRQMILNR